MSYYVVRSDNDLAHHGVLGMKWGVWNEETRARRSGSRNPKKKKYDYSELSDKELQDKLNRKRNEDQLRQLEKKEEPKSKAKVSEETLKTIRNSVAITAAILASFVAIKNNYSQLKPIFTKVAEKYKNIKMSQIDNPPILDWSFVKDKSRYMDFGPVATGPWDGEWAKILKYI